MERLSVALPTPGNDCAERIRSLHYQWQNGGRKEPFVILFDEIDKLIPDAAEVDSEPRMHEFVRLFRTLRELAQVDRCLVSLVTAYRADVNRLNILSPRIGENPMFLAFKEVPLGFLAKDECMRMIHSIGSWKEISWSREAAMCVCESTGGHPLLTRFLASAVCKGGALRSISLDDVKDTITQQIRSFRRTDIGHYYKNEVWQRLVDREKNVLRCLANSSFVAEEGALAVEFEEGLTALEDFGLVHTSEGKVSVVGGLFREWLKRRVRP
jgi:hypothetical protein